MIVINFKAKIKNITIDTIIYIIEPNLKNIII